MGRHSQSDRDDAAASLSEPASGVLATGEPTWDQWWEKTGRQPKIVDPPFRTPEPSPPSRRGTPPTSSRAGGPLGAPDPLGSAAGPRPPANRSGPLPPPGVREVPTGSARRRPGADARSSAGPRMPLAPPPGPTSTGPLSPAFPLTPDAPAAARPPLRAVSTPADAGRGGTSRSRPGGHGAGVAARAATAAAVPLPYETSSGIPAASLPAPPLPAPGPPAAGRAVPSAAGSDRAVEPPLERSRHREAARRRDTGAATPTGILPAPSRRTAPDTTGATPRLGPDTGGIPAVRALPDLGDDDDRRGRARSRRGALRARRAEAEPDVDGFADLRGTSEPEPDSPDRSPDRRAARPLRAVDSDPDAGENTGIHYGFEDEPSLLLQWGAFVMQTLVGAVCGLGVWLGFYQLWERWPFYTVPTAGAAMAAMLAVTRSIRRRYGHDLDLVTGMVTVGVGVVLTVLPAAFVLQHV